MNSSDSSPLDFSVSSTVIPRSQSYTGTEEEDEADEYAPFSLGDQNLALVAEGTKAVLALDEMKLRCGLALGASAFIALTAIALACYSLLHPYREALTVQQSASINRTLSWMNTSADVCEDPWEYFCGGFLATAKLPPGKMHYAASFSLVQDTVSSQLLDVMQEDRNWPVLTTLQKSCLNVTYRAERGLKPMAGPLVMLLNAKNISELGAATAAVRLTQGLLVQPFFAFTVEIDAKSSLPMKHMLNVAPGTLLFSDPAYYAHGQLMSSYAEWIQSAFTAGGISGVTPERAARLVQLETQLANAKESKFVAKEFTLAQLHQFSHDEVAPRLRGFDPSEDDDENAYYNELSLEQLYAICPPGYFQSHLSTLFNASLTQSVNVESLDYLYAACEILGGSSYETLKDAALLALLSRTLPYLGPVQTAAMDQFSLLLYGTDPSEKTQLERCTSVTEQLLESLTSQYYIDRYFSEEKKEAVKAMVTALKSSFEEELDRFSWLDTQSKSGAELKFSTLTYQIGYPDEWPSTDRLLSRSGGRVFEEGRFYENAMSLRKARDNEQLSRLRHPVTPDELHSWQMAATTVNAYYSPESNSVVFPAAILQDPFYSQDAPASANWGAIGSVIGHELAHMNSGSGTHFNSAGQLSDWMSAEAKVAWQQRMECFEEQFSELTFDEIPINGKQVLGEAVADSWGAHHSWLVMQKQRADNYTATLAEETFVRENYGMSLNELFFVSFVQTYCSISTDEYNKLLVRLDEHPLDRFRVEQTLRNSQEFSDVFGCPEGSKFNPTERCELD